MRNLYHIFIGFTLLYWIGSVTDFATFTLTSKIFGCTLAALIIGAGEGGFWEWLQSLKNPKNFDFNDIGRTMIGTFIGGVFSIFVPDVYWLIYSTLAISITLVLIDLVKMYKTNSKK